jgi:murein DD-endopeptidase MepM/ murein hydrolase activator NlpD
MTEKRLILNQAKLSQFHQTSRKSLLVGVSSLMMFGMVAAFGTAPDTLTYTGEINNIVEQLSLPSMAPIEPGSDIFAREIRIQQGDTVSALLSRLDIQDDEVSDYLRSSKETDAFFRQLAPGKTLSARISLDGTLSSLIFPLNGSKDAALQIQRTPEGLQAHILELQLESRVSMQTAVIRHSLFGAADDAGIPDSVAVQLADIFGGDIDFHRDLRKGDRFSVIYETATYTGKPIRAERILAAELWNDGKKYQAFWFQTQQGTGGYYTAEGKSVRKAFLRSPLEFSRITSGFSNARYHPVLHETRAHRGIDYGAPIGTRVKATANGIIEFAGTRGGYGKLIMLRHPGDKVTVYGHLSGFAPGIRNGTKVEQGAVIGYVGATGLATGPHLHYEFRVAGIHRNPLTIALPDAQPLPDHLLETFHTQANSLLAKISAIREHQLLVLD